MSYSINYVEISCTYNKLHLKLFAGSVGKNGAARRITFRGRRYEFKYVVEEDMFNLYSTRGVLLGCLVGGVFQFYVSSAPEIGLDGIFSLLAMLNIYPTK